MAFIINGTNGLTFPDTTTQSTRAVDRSGDTMTGQLTLSRTDTAFGANTVALQLTSTHHPFLKFTSSNLPTKSWGLYMNGDTNGNLEAYTYLNSRVNWHVTHEGYVTSNYQPRGWGRFYGIPGTQTNPTLTAYAGNLAGGMYISSGRVYVPTSGYYLFHAQALATGAALYWSIRKNGVTIAHHYVGGDIQIDRHNMVIVEMATGDYFDVYIGGTVTYLWGGSEHCIWNCVKLG